MPSVAGQIRIDLIAQAAQFNAGLRSGKQELGSFREEFERTNKAFESKKNVSSRIDSEKAAWKAATTDMRLTMERDFGKNRYDTLRFNALGMMNATNDRAEDNRIRWKSMIPWGNSLRVELTREQAMTAALLGEQKQSLIREFSKSAQDLAGAGLGAAGYGGILGKATSFASSPMGAATIGIAAITGMVAHAVREHDQLAREVRSASMRFGSSSESASRLMASGIDESHISRVQRAMSEQTDKNMRGFNTLGLDPNALADMPIEASLKKIADGFQKIPNAADRARVAFELFGRGGYEVLSTLQRMDEKIKMMGEHELIHPEDIERVKAWDKALKGAHNTLGDLSLRIAHASGGKSGIGTQFMRGIESFPYWIDALGGLGTGTDKQALKKFDAMDRRWRREDYNLEHANRIAMQKAGVDNATAYGLEDKYDTGKITREEYDQEASKLIDAMQINTHRIEAQAEKRDEAAKKLKEAEDKLFGMEEGKPALEREKWLRDVLAGGVGGGIDSAGVPQGDLANWAARYDNVKSIEEGRKQDEKFNKERDQQEERDYREAIRAEEERFGREMETKKRLRSPKKIARDELRDLDEFRGSLTGDEYRRGKSQIAEKLVGAMGGGEIQTVGMMSAGSAELHSLIARANMPDAKEALMRDALAILENIERELANQNGEVL